MAASRYRAVSFTVQYKYTGRESENRGKRDKVGSKSKEREIERQIAREKYTCFHANEAFENVREQRGQTERTKPRGSRERKDRARERERERVDRKSERESGDRHDRYT